MQRTSRPARTPIAGLDGFVLDLDAMWADAERFPDEE